MKKKTARKLVLAKETITVLDSQDIRAAMGAYGTMETQCCATMMPCSNASCHTDTSPIQSA
ncbi:MAG TPA: class I lanthipeptide [Thermoanaerobaculia bacterium]|nr:class I lanthipeptide [Thermoanaerobaculia bacterium]